MVFYRPRRCSTARDRHRALGVIALLTGCNGDAGDASPGTDTTTVTGSTLASTVEPDETLTDGGPGAPDTTTTAGATQDSGTTGLPCPPSTLDCPCGVKDQCEGELLCMREICTGPATTTGSETGVLPPGCSNGQPDPGETCYAEAELFASGGEPHGVLIADVNGDEHLDIVVTRAGSNMVSVRLGDGTGTVGTAQLFSAGMRPLAVAADSFDDDDAVDLVVANEAGNNIGILLGAGDGSFGSPSLFAVGTGPTAVVTADLDDNGGTDVITAEAGGITILMASGFGFAPPQTLPAAGTPVSVALAELSSDTSIDMLAADNTNGTFTLRLGAGGATFGAAQSFTSGANPVAVAGVDLNGDGNADVVTANAGGDLSVRYGDGLGSVGPPIPFDIGGTPRALVAAFIDPDEYIDLAVAAATSNEVTVLLGTGTGVFEAARVFEVGSDARAIAAGDLNADGVADLVVTHGADDLLSLLLSDA